jgi:hypothetical protein
MYYFSNSFLQAMWEEEIKGSSPDKAAPGSSCVRSQGVCPSEKQEEVAPRGR